MNLYPLGFIHESNLIHSANRRDSRWQAEGNEARELLRSLIRAKAMVDRHDEDMFQELYFERPLRRLHHLLLHVSDHAGVRYVSVQGSNLVAFGGRRLRSSIGWHSTPAATVIAEALHLWAGCSHGPHAQIHGVFSCLPELNGTWETDTRARIGDGLVRGQYNMNRVDQPGYPYHLEYNNEA